MTDSAPRPDVSLADIASTVAGELRGDAAVVLHGVAGLDQAGAGELSFVETDRFIERAAASKAGALIVHRIIEKIACPQVAVAQPKLAFARIIEAFFLPPRKPSAIADSADLGASVEIGVEPVIGPFVAIGDRVRIGDRVTLHPGVTIADDCVLEDDVVLHANVSIRERCRVGSRVTIHDGTVIGSDGFGYVQHEGRHVKVPQVGIAVIENDVEIGANVTVDRGAFGETRIRQGSKIDNLVQIAHNVEIGEHAIIVAQVGISGSTRLGRGVVAGGQAGLAGHLEIGDGTMIAARSGVNRSLAGGQIVSGAPAIPHQTSILAQAVIPRLPEMRQKLRRLEKRVAELESSQRPDARADDAPD